MQLLVNWCLSLLIAAIAQLDDRLPFSVILSFVSSVALCRQGTSLLSLKQIIFIMLYVTI
jgi:hypothetical protein